LFHQNRFQKAVFQCVVTGAGSPLCRNCDWDWKGK